MVKSGDPLPPPTSDGVAHQRRIYNVADPIALAHVFAGAYQTSMNDEPGRDGTALFRASSAVRAFVKLMREPYDD